MWKDCIIHEPWFRMDLVNFGHRECGRIVSFVNFGSEWIRWNLVIENVVGLYHPWTSVQNGSGELWSSRMWKDCIICDFRFRMDQVNFGHRECGRIVSSMKFGSEWIRWTSVIEKVVGLHHPWTLIPKEIQRLLCLCIVVCRLLMMMMMLLIERSECDDDDILMLIFWWWWCWYFDDVDVLIIMMF